MIEICKPEICPHRVHESMKEVAAFPEYRKHKEDQVCFSFSPLVFSNFAHVELDELHIFPWSELCTFPYYLLSMHRLVTLNKFQSFARPSGSLFESWLSVLAIVKSLEAENANLYFSVLSDLHSLAA